jgi:EpsI family protein
MVFMSCIALMLGEIALLNRFGHESGTWRQLFGVEFPAPTPAGAVIRQRGTPKSFIAAGLLLVGFIATSLALPRAAEVFPARSAFAEYPMQLGEWHGRRETIDAAYLDVLKLDDYLLADYADPAGGAVNLYVAYYNSQRKGEAVHSPRSCLPGGGWQLREFDQRTVSTVKIDGQPLRVNRTLIELGNERELVYYWFQQRGRVVTNEFVVKWYLFWDALTRHRTDGALVRVITTVPPGTNESQADDRLTEFVARITGDLNRFIPN